MIVATARLLERLRTSDFSGVLRVISAKSETDRKRVPFVTGLN
jgi:hypothetical protein